MSVSASVDGVWAEFVATRRAELRDELIVEYAPLVRFVVGRLGIPPTGILDAEDLISYGVIGLINAIDRFDPSRVVPAAAPVRPARFPPAARASPPSAAASSRRATGQ